MSPKRLGIAVMREPQSHFSRQLLALDGDPRRTGEDLVREPFFQAVPAGEPAGRRVGDDQVECAAVTRAGGARHWAKRAGAPQLTTSLCVPTENSKDRAAGVGVGRELRRRGAAGVDDEHVSPGLDALIAGVGRVGQSLRPRVIIGEHGGEEIGGRDAHSVEQRQRAVAMAQQPQHRQHAVDRIQ